MGRSPTLWSQIHDVHWLRRDHLSLKIAQNLGVNLLASNFSMVYDNKLDGSTEYTASDVRSVRGEAAKNKPGYLSAPSVEPSDS